MTLVDAIRRMYLGEAKDSPPFDVSKGDFAAAAKELTQYAKSKGGMDKADFLSFANRMAVMAKPHSPKVAAKFAKDMRELDTDVREKIIYIMRSNGIKIKWTDKGFRIEDVEIEWMDLDELDEAVNMDKVRNTYNSIMKGNRRGQPDDDEVGDYIPRGMTKADIAALIKMLAKQGYDAKFLTKDLAPLATEEVQIEEIEEAYRPPTQAEIERDKERERRAKGQSRNTGTYTRSKQYKNYMGGLKKEESEVDEAMSPAQAGAYEAGKKAARAGKKYEDNPNKKGTAEFTAWSKGHNEARAKRMNAEEFEIDEAKRDPSKSGGSGYDLYHKDFSTAMQHAYKYAKDKLGITIDPKEIDDKVASGPRKPSAGKTNTYRLKGDKGSVQIQVANLDNKKYELNMYKESVELDEMRVLATKGKTKVVTKGDGVARVMVGNKEIASGDLDDGAGGWFMSRPGEKGQKFFNTAQKIADYYKEETEMENIEELKAYDKNADFRLLNRLAQKAKTQKLTPAEVKQKANAQSRLRNHGVKEEAELDEAEFLKWEVKVGGKSWRGTARNAGEAVKKARPSMGNLDLSKASVTRIKEDIDVEERKLSLEEAVMLSVFGEAKKEEKKDKKAPETDKDDDGEGMDPVDKKALKKDYDDRAKDGDGDIDNDGDEDKTDKYLHKKRQAVTKAINKKKGPQSTGKSAEPVDTNPSMDEEMSDAQMKKRDEIMKGLEKKKGEFVSKYGDRAKEVMARTATKMAMKESSDAYGKSQQAIADRKKREAMKQSDKDKLGKLAAMMAREKK